MTLEIAGILTKFSRNKPFEELENLDNEYLSNISKKIANERELERRERQFEIKKRKAEKVLESERKLQEKKRRLQDKKDKVKKLVEVKKIELLDLILNNPKISK